MEVWAYGHGNAKCVRAARDGSPGGNGGVREWNYQILIPGLWQEDKMIGYLKMVMSDLISV